MSSRIKVELKAGKCPEEGHDDTREVFLGIVDQTPGSSLVNDNWFRKLPGQKQEHLYFAVHVSEGHSPDVVQEIDAYNHSAKSAEKEKSDSSRPMSPIAFINGLRSRYVNRMPRTAEGKVIYGITLPNGRLQFRCSEDVTHRRRLEC
jgi:hypothetical protein